MVQDYQTPGVLASGDHPRVRVHVRARARASARAFVRRVSVKARDTHSQAQSGRAERIEA